MRENKHSKKLAFAVLAATAAVGVSAVAPVSAASINTADGLIVTSDTPVSSNVAVPTTVVTGSGNNKMKCAAHLVPLVHLVTKTM